MPTAADFADSARRFATIADEVVRLSAGARPHAGAVHGGVLQADVRSLMTRLESEPRSWARQLESLSVTCRERQAFIEDLEARWRAWWQHQEHYRQEWLQWNLSMQLCLATHGGSGWPGPEPVLHHALEPEAAPAWADLRP